MVDVDTAAERMIANGCERVSMSELVRRLDSLGYRLDRSMDCRAPARFMTGPLAGMVYPCCSGYITQKDDGLSFANVDARRDANFRALQDMRRSGLFAVSRGAIFEL